MHLAEDGDVRGIGGRRIEGEFDLVLAEERGLVRGDQADAFHKLSKTGGPAVEKTEPAGRDGELGHADQVDDANEYKISVGFLADIFTDQGALEVG